MDAMCWVARGNTRSMFARRLLIAYLLWCVKRGVEVAVSYLRTSRNVTADDIARLDDTERAEW